MNDICKYCKGTGVYRPRKNAYQCKYCNGTGKLAELIVSKEKRCGDRPQSILDLKRPADVFSIEYHVYPDQIQAVAKIIGVLEPFVMYLRTKHFDWAMTKFNAALNKHRWISEKNCSLKVYYYKENYNPMHKENPYKEIEI